MSVPYTVDEATEARRWSNRYGPANAWTGTTGTAARMIGRLLDERERLMAKQAVMAPGDDYIRDVAESAARQATLRDTFAASALSGLLASDQYDQLVTPADYADTAYELADAMLRERAKAIHDAAPAARASLPADDHASGWSCSGGLPRCGDGTGNHSSPACDGVDVLPDAGSSGPINHSAPACQPPVASRGSEESERRDVARPDTTGKVAGGPARHTQEPVAWAVMQPDSYVVVNTLQSAFAMRDMCGGGSIVPLYRHPQPALTDAEREAVERLCDATNDMIADDKRAGGCHWRDDAAAVAIVRGLLERTK